MIKRISLLVMAALLVATMAMAGLAGPAFAGTTTTSPKDAKALGLAPGTVVEFNGSSLKFNGSLKDIHKGVRAGD